MVERKDPGPDSDELYRKVGLLTRQLHDSLRELGYDRQLESAVSSLPDARNRLSYISRRTGQAAETVLNGVDRAKAELDGIAAGAAGVAAELRADPVAVVASGQVMTYLEETRLAAERADAQLTEIMLAQDFHDLGCHHVVFGRRDVQEQHLRRRPDQVGRGELGIDEPQRRACAQRDEHRHTNRQGHGPL
jgi:chemotaxis protein CheZ